jgi:6-phosphogluconolactonase
MERKLQIVADALPLARGAAAVFVDTASHIVKQKGRVAVALSGGSTPKAFYSLLTVGPELRARVPRQQTYFFFGDEGHIPADHSDSSFRTTCRRGL